MRMWRAIAAALLVLLIGPVPASSSEFALTVVSTATEPAHAGATAPQGYEYRAAIVAIAGDDEAANAALSQSQAEDADGFPNAVLIESTEVLDRRLIVVLIDQATPALTLVLPDGLGRLPLVEGASVAVSDTADPTEITTVSRDGLDYTLRRASIADNAGGQAAPADRAFATIELTVTNRTEQGVSLALASLAQIVEDGRFLYPLEDTSNVLSLEAVNDHLYEPNLPVNLKLAVLVPIETGHLELVVHGPSGAVKLPLDNKTASARTPIAGPVESGILSASLLAADWTETEAGRTLTVDVDVALTSDNPLEVVDIPDGLVSLVNGAGEQWLRQAQAPLRRPFRPGPLFAGGESVLGGALRFVLPAEAAGPFKLRVDGVDPAILLAVPDSDGGSPGDVVVDVPVAPLTLAFETSPITAGVPIVVAYAGMPGNAEDWLAIARAGSADDQYVQTVSLNGQTAGRAEFGSLEAGDYELRAYFNWPDNGYRVEQRLAFSVEPKPDVVSGSLLTLGPGPIEAGDPVVVTWQGFAGFDTDWIAVSRKDEPDGSYLSYRYLHGQKTGRLVFDALPIGEYEMRAYFKDEKVVQDRVSFTVKARRFARPVRDDAALAGTTNVALVARGAFIDTANRDGLLMGDGDASAYDAERGFAVLQPDGVNRIWFARPYPVESIRFLLWDGKPARYGYVLKGTADGVTWSILADRSAEPVAGGWQDVATGGQSLIGISFESLLADGDGAFRLVEVAAYTAASVDVPDSVVAPDGEMPDWQAALPDGPVNLALPAIGARIDGDGAGNALDGLFSGYAASASAGAPLVLTLDQAYPLDLIRVDLSDELQPAFKVEASEDGTTFFTLGDFAERQHGRLDIDAGGKRVAVVRISAVEGAAAALGVVELQTLSSAHGLPINRTTTRQPAAQLTAGRNLALRINGGRITGISSERDAIHTALNLNDGDARTDWHSADTTFPEDMVIALGGRMPAMVDSVDIFESGYGAEPLVVELAAGTVADGWVPLGRYGLHRSPVERLSFPAVKAQFVRLRVVKAESDHFVTIGEVAVHEAAMADAEAHIATHWPGFAGGLNIAMLAVGGAVVSAAPYGDDPDYGPFKLIDGYGSGTGAWADTAEGDVAQVTIGFAGGAEATVAGLAFIVDGGSSNFTANDRWTRMVDVWSSSSAPDSGFVWRGRYGLDQSSDKQVVSFAPVQARYVRVVMLDTFGSAGPVMGEIEVLEAPGPSITAAGPPNILDLRYGGHLTVPAGSNRSYLIDSSSATDGWYDDTGSRPIDITFGFDQDQPRTFNAIGLNPRTSLDEATWARRAKILVSDHPLRDFRLLAEVEIAPEDRLQYFDVPTTTARYLQIRLIDNRGAETMSLGEVAVREAVEAGELSSVATREDGSQHDPVQVDDVPAPFEGELVETEPNDTPGDADALPFGQRMTGAISPLSDKDWFAFDTTNAATSAVNAVVEEQPRLNSELSLFGPDQAPIGTQPLYDLGVPRADFTWLMPKGRNTLSLSRAPNSIVFIVDRSGSVDAVRKDIASAAVRFAENSLPDEEISFVSMDGEILYNDFTSDKEALIAAALKTSEGSSGSPVYASLQEGMKRLGNREGAKAIVIVTDGEDSGSSAEPLYELWRDLSKTGVRIYTVGFGAAVTHPLDGLLGATGGDMLRAFSTATGGRFFYAPSGEAMRDIYARISADLRSESGYRLSLAPSASLGALEIVSSGEPITGVSAPHQVGLILDASGSMKKQLDDGSTRMTAARETLNGLVDSLPDSSQVSLVVYGHRLPSKPHSESCKDIELAVPFGALDRDRLHGIIDSIKARGETPIGRSLLALAQSFDRAAERKFAILITDGEESCDPNPDDPAYPPKVIAALRDAGIDITLSIVGFAIGDEATREFMEKLAQSTGGAYYNAADRAALEDALRAAFSASYSVSDSLGQPAAAGKVGGGSIALPEGRWHVVLDSDPALDLGTIPVTGNTTTRVELSREGDRVDVRVQ